MSQVFPWGNHEVKVERAERLRMKSKKLPYCSFHFVSANCVGSCPNGDAQPKVALFIRDVINCAICKTNDAASSGKGAVLPSLSQPLLTTEAL